MYLLTFRTMNIYPAYISHEELKKNIYSEKLKSVKTMSSVKLAIVKFPINLKSICSVDKWMNKPDTLDANTTNQFSRKLTCHNLNLSCVTPVHT